MPRQLKDMVVIITGASAGIGMALAVELSRHGAKLVLSARRQDRLDALNGSLGGGHLCVQADVSRESDCRALIEQSARHFGRIDTLVCNAGYGIIRTVAKTSAEEMRDIFQTNLFGTSDCIREAVPIMEAQDLRDGWRGQLIIVSSAAARRGLPYYGAYSATKFAQLALTEALRVELRPQRIAATSVHPVGTQTEFFSAAEGHSDRKMPAKWRNEVRQSPETVARKMVAAIRRPKPEVWPMAPARFGLSLGTFFPGLVDRAMRRFSRALAEEEHSE